MANILIHRPARKLEASQQSEPLVIAAPPQQGDTESGGFPLRTLLPVIGSLSSIVMIVVLRANPVMVAIGAVILVVALVGGIGMAVSQKGQAARLRKRERERYLDYLETLREELSQSNSQARTKAMALYPEPAFIGQIANNPERLWDRRRSDPDFLTVRIGTCSETVRQIILPTNANPVQPFDPIMIAEATAIQNTYSTIPEMPATLDIRKLGTISIVGSIENAFALSRSMMAQLMVSHSADDLKIALAIPEEHLSELPEIDLAPHMELETWDGPQRGRRIAPSSNDLVRMLNHELSERAMRATNRQRNGLNSAASETRLIIFCDHSTGNAFNVSLPDGFKAEQLGITIIALVTDRLNEPTDTQLRLTVESRDELLIEPVPLLNDPVLLARPDSITPGHFSSIVTRLAALRLSPDNAKDLELNTEIDVLKLLGISSVSNLSTSRWTKRDSKNFLRVNIGSGDDGSPVYLDLKESAQGGMGPHGICIGATGSGKSEFLRTLVLGLAVTHSPEDLSMILVDYKGGTAFTPFQHLPHIAGLMDNLENDAQLIERARASISGEIIRRQKVLKESGSFASISDYRQARLSRTELEPLPHLFLVIDEFGELLTAQPEFIDLLLQIGRIGRALGIHLLLANQRIEGGKLRGLDTYLSYRIGLRTFSEQESSVIIETPDAFHLPPEPGWGYLKVDTTIYSRFKAAYVSGPLPEEQRATDENEETIWGVFMQPPYNTIESSQSETSSQSSFVDSPASGRAKGPSLLESVVGQLDEESEKVAPVWLPPLPDRIPIFQVLTTEKPLQVPVGLIDEPLKQSQKPWLLDLSRAGGHFAIVGAPQTGRSTFLRTFAAGLATTHTPQQVTIYGLDLTGSGLARLEDFPHVGSVATRSNREQQLRLLEELQQMINERERIFRTHRIESLTQFRNKHAAGEINVNSPDVVLLVDGYGLIKQDFDYLADNLADLLTRGSSFGIHLVIALTRWNEVTMNLQPLIGNKIELRLNDPSESTIKRKLSETIRSSQAGRALTDEMLFAQIALPVVNEVPDDYLGDALTELAIQTAKSWNGPTASPIRLLPEDLEPNTLPDAFEAPDSLPIGLRQDTMEPMLLELSAADQHVLILGDSKSGKTTTLRQVSHTLLERYSPEELVLAVMEPRGDLSGTIPDEYLGGQANNSIKAKQLAAALALELDKRQNDGADANLRIVLLVDDYDILASGGTSPLEPLLPYLASSRDLNFNVLLTRPVAGASRALFQTTIQSLRDTGGTGIILSGERSEGPLWPGVYASASVPGRAKLVRRGQPPRLVQIANRAANVEQGH